MKNGLMNDIRNRIINDVLIPSIHMLYKVDYANIYYGVSERNICARLAHHMENIMREYHDKKMFQDYYADVEYNRIGKDGVLKYYEDSEHEPQYMVSDLLIHRRGISPNLLAVEIKKKGNHRNEDKDKERLKSLVYPSSNYSNTECVHDTLVGAFITYSEKYVRMELYESDEDCRVSTKTIHFIVSGAGSLTRINA